MAIQLIIGKAKTISSKIQFYIEIPFNFKTAYMP